MSYLLIVDGKFVVGAFSSKSDAIKRATEMGIPTTTNRRNGCVDYTIIPFEEQNVETSYDGTTFFNRGNWSV